MDSQQSVRILRRRAVRRIFRRRSWRVVSWGVALAVIVGAATYHFEHPVYRTSAQVLLAPENSAASLMPTPAPVRPSGYDVAQVDIVQSGPVAQAASAAMPGHPSPELLLSQVTASVDPGTDMMTIVAESGDPAEAQGAANAFGHAYIANTYRSSIVNLVAVVKGRQPQLDRIQAQITALDTRILQSSESKGDAANVGTLTAQRNLVQTQYAALFSVQQSARTMIQLTHPQASLVTAAGLPGTPISPKPLNAALFGLIVGLVIGSGIELRRAHADVGVALRTSEGTPPKRS